VWRLATCFLWPEGVKRSHIQSRLLQFPDRQKTPALSTVFNCVRSAKCGKETAQLALFQHPVIMVEWCQTQAPAEMAAMYNFRRGRCWASTCLLLTLKNINTAWDELSANHFQTSILQNTHFQLFFLASNIIFRLLKPSTLNNCFSSKMSKKTNKLRYI